MKELMSRKWGAVLLSLVLPLAGGCLQDTSNAASSSSAEGSGEPTPAPTILTGDTPASTNAPVESAEAPEVADPLSDAPIKEVAVEKAPPTGVKPTPATEEIVRLANAGVDEAVMTTYVNNSPNRFDLKGDEIVYLKDIGVPPAVVTAMIERDQVLKGSGVAQAAAPQQATPPPPPQPQAPNPADVAPQAVQPAQAAPVPVPVAAPSQPVDNNTFYGSLSPYGRWMEVDGYGMVWQPTVVVANSGWQPYFNDGHWVYTDCGWYWHSDYSWGWAPFHYGRWFRHHRAGWCWAPDVVWGPSWVSWRYTDGYCGWAPLPPSACYRPGIGFTYYGRSVGFGFSFGLGVDCYSFVSSVNFCSPRLHHYALPREHVGRIYGSTTVITRIASHNNVVMNHGIDVGRMSRESGHTIRPIPLRDTTSRPGPGRMERAGGDGRSIPVYRPQVPPMHSPVSAMSDRSRPSGGIQHPGSREIPNREVQRPPTAQRGPDGNRGITPPSNRTTPPAESGRPGSRGSRLGETPTAPAPIQHPSNPTRPSQPDRPSNPGRSTPPDRSGGTPRTSPQLNSPASSSLTAPPTTRPSTPVAMPTPPAAPTRPSAPAWTTPPSGSRNGTATTPQQPASGNPQGSPSQGGQRGGNASSYQTPGPVTRPSQPAYQPPTPVARPTPTYQPPAPVTRPTPAYQPPAPVARPTPTYQAPTPNYQAPKYQAPAPSYQAPQPSVRPSAPSAPSQPQQQSRQAPAESGNRGGSNKRSDR